MISATVMITERLPPIRITKYPLLYLKTKLKELAVKYEKAKRSNKKLKDQNCKLIERLRHKNRSGSICSNSSCETLGENEGSIQLSKHSQYQPRLKVLSPFIFQCPMVHNLVAC